MSTAVPHAPILITRPRAQGKRFAARVQDRLGDGPVVLSPVLDIISTGANVTFSGYAGAIFTSANGVRHVPPSPHPTFTAHCVGTQTALAAADAGFAVRNADGAWQDLADLILSDPPPGPLVYPRGCHTTGALAETLAAGGVQVTTVEVYNQREQPLSDAALALLRGSDPVLIPVFSPRTAQILSHSMVQARAKLFIAAISPAVAKALPVQSAARVEVASEPTANAILDCLVVLQTALRA